ncbi:MAG: hypothetical protein ABEI96_01195 [Haloarculaceae archaeon]
MGSTDYQSCLRCGTDLTSAAVRFEDRVYCANCVETFQAVADGGVIVESRHGTRDYDEKPYLVSGGGERYIEYSQVEALARGQELAARLDVRGLFIYWRNGSHWLLQTYLDQHPKIRADVQDERQKIRGRTRSPGTVHADADIDHRNISADGDVIIDSTVVNDAVVNRSAIGDGESENEQ